MTVKDLKMQQADVGKCILKLDNCIQDHGVVEVPEEQMNSIRQMLHNYFEFIEDVINKTEVV